VAACRANKMPHCKHGTGRKLDQPGDDAVGRLCWFHKSKRSQDKQVESCQR
jgi:hypothetical protein